MTTTTIVSDEGDLWVFANPDSASRHMEPIDVRKGRMSCFDVHGNGLTLKIVKAKGRFAEAEIVQVGLPFENKTVELRALIENVLDQSGSSPRLDSSIEDLVEQLIAVAGIRP